jgi:hypothetical protein
MVDQYFRELALTMARESELLGALYRHPGKLGENRESLLARFLSSYLPRRYGVSSGFALLGGELSTEQDVVVYDQVDNPVLFPDASAPLFPPSALKALVEVKSRLTKRELKRTVVKTARLKRGLRVAFANHPAPPQEEALVMLLAFRSALAVADIHRLLRELEDDEGVADADRLDLVCVLNEGLVVGGPLLAVLDNERERDRGRLAVALEDSLFVFYVLLLDRLAAMAPTPPRLMSYLSPATPMGVVVAEG